MMRHCIYNEKSRQPKLPRFLLVISHLPQALSADILPLVGHQALGRRTENAGRLVLLQDDTIILHKDLDLIPLSDIQRTPDLDGQNDSSQLVYLANNTRRFHKNPPHIYLSTDMIIVLINLSVL
jgi:hypothetical protein